MKKLYSFSISLIFIIGLISNNTFSQIIREDAKWIKVIDNLNFPEGPIYDGKSSLYFSNCYGGWIGKVNLTSDKLDTFIIKNNSRIKINKTNGLAYGKDNNLYACEYAYGQILRIDKDANVEVFSNGYEGERFNRPNDIVIDSKGNIFFTDPKSYDKDSLDGRIFIINKNNGTLELAAKGLAFPNGINISPIDNKLYVCESAKHIIVRFDITEDCQLINKVEFAQLPGGDPDGIEFDNDGNLYVAHYGGKAVYIFSPDGKQIAKIETPGSKPTNLEFVDKECKTLYLTEVETNSLYKISFSRK